MSVCNLHGYDGCECVNPVEGAPARLKLDQVGLAAIGASKPISTEDPLWCLEWQQVSGLRAEMEAYKMRYRQAIRRAHSYGWPIERTSRTWEWVPVAVGEPLEWETWVYRIKE